MTRSELILRLASRFPQLLRKDAEAAVTGILGALHQALMQGRRIEVRGFGSFKLKYRSPRLKRNPKTGETVPRPGHWTPHFTSGRGLRERVKDSAPLRRNSP